jgi:hypothetical protein
LRGDRLCGFQRPTPRDGFKSRKRDRLLNLPERATKSELSCGREWPLPKGANRRGFSSLVGGRLRARARRLRRPRATRQEKPRTMRREPGLEAWWSQGGLGRSVCGIDCGASGALIDRHRRPAGVSQRRPAQGRQSPFRPQAAGSARPCEIISGCLAASVCHGLATPATAWRRVVAAPPFPALSLGLPKCPIPRYPHLP